MKWIYQIIISFYGSVKERYEQVDTYMIVRFPLSPSSPFKSDVIVPCIVIMCIKLSIMQVPRDEALASTVGELTNTANYSGL